MDDGNEQNLCMPCLFSICLGMRFNTLIWNSSFSQSCFPNERLRPERVKMFIYWHYRNKESTTNRPILSDLQNNV